MTGANGRLGRDIAASVADLGKTDEVVLLTRDPDAVGDLRDCGFDIRRADFGDTESMTAALEGIDTLLMISATGPASVRIPLHRSAFDAIENSEVRKVVYTSRVAPYSSSPYPCAAIHEYSEERLKSLKGSYTILRNNEYAENLERYLSEAERTGILRYGAKGPIAFIARRDVVAAAVAAFFDDTATDKVYELSGPEALDRVHLAAALSEATGKTIACDDGTAEAFSETARSMGEPDFISEMRIGLYRASELGEWMATMPDDTRSLLPTEPTPVSQYIKASFGN